MRNKNVLPIIFTAKTNLFYACNTLKTKAFKTVIKHRLKAIQKHIKNELGNREKNKKMHISFWKNAHFVFAIIHNNVFSYLYLLVFTEPIKTEKRGLVRTLYRKEVDNTQDNHATQLVNT